MHTKLLMGCLGCQHILRAHIRRAPAVIALRSMPDHTCSATDMAVRGGMPWMQVVADQVPKMSCAWEL